MLSCKSIFAKKNHKIQWQYHGKIWSNLKVLISASCFKCRPLHVCFKPFKYFPNTVTDAKQQNFPGWSQQPEWVRHQTFTRGSAVKLQHQRAASSRPSLMLDSLDRLRLGMCWCCWSCPILPSQVLGYNENQKFNISRLNKVGTRRKYQDWSFNIEECGYVREYYRMVFLASG